MKEIQFITETTDLNNTPNVIWDAEALNYAGTDGWHEQNGTYPILDYKSRHIAIIFKDSGNHAVTIIRVGGAPLQFIENADDEIATPASSLR